MLPELNSGQPRNPRSIDGNNYPENPETSQLSGDVRMMVVLVIALRFGTPTPGAGFHRCALHREEVG